MSQDDGGSARISPITLLSTGLRPAVGVVYVLYLTPPVLKLSSQLSSPSPGDVSFYSTKSPSYCQLTSVAHGRFHFCDDLVFDSRPMRWSLDPFDPCWTLPSGDFSHELFALTDAGQINLINNQDRPYKI